MDPQATIKSVSEDACNNGLEGKPSDAMEGGTVHLCFFSGRAQGQAAAQRHGSARVGHRPGKHELGGLGEGRRKRS